MRRPSNHHHPHRRPILSFVVLFPPEVLEAPRAKNLLLKGGAPRSIWRRFAFASSDLLYRHDIELIQVQLTACPNGVVELDRLHNERRILNQLAERCLAFGSWLPAHATVYTRRM